MNVLKKLYCSDERSWGTGICSFKTEEFEIIDLLSRDYNIKDLCSLMGVSRSGYYKWKNGYRWTAAFIRINYGFDISDNYAYKCFRYLGIKSETKHKIHQRPRKIKDKYPNLIFSTWETVDRPKQVIVSDMTTFKFWIFYFEVTFYFDVFTKEILSWKLAERRGSREQYLDGLKDVVELLKNCNEPTFVKRNYKKIFQMSTFEKVKCSKKL